jgi:hypothetical protein
LRFRPGRKRLFRSYVSPNRSEDVYVSEPEAQARPSHTFASDFKNGHG